MYDAGPGFNALKTPGITFVRDSARGLHAVIPEATVAHIAAKTHDGSGARPSDAAAYIGQGRKLIMYHGFSDGLITPYRTIQYYKALAALHGGYDQLRKNVALFMVPDMGHCGGGPGATVFGQGGPRGTNNGSTDAEHDIVTALDEWVEHGNQPTKVIAAKLSGNSGGVQTAPNEMVTVTRTMPLCPYPAMAKYNGTGDINAAASWVCPPGDTRLEKTDPAGTRAGVNAPIK